MTQILSTDECFSNISADDKSMKLNKTILIPFSLLERNRCGIFSSVINTTSST